MSDAGALALVRRGLLWLAGAGIAATAIELANARHWETAVQLIPWAALTVVAAAALLVAVRPSGARLRGARALAGTVLLASLYGIYMHVTANYDAGPLDGTYGPGWDAASQAQRLWWAATQTVGPSPTLAPAALTQIAALVLLGTVRHPALARRAAGRDAVLVGDEPRPAEAA